MAAEAPRMTFVDRLLFLWAVGGVVLLLGRALHRLAPVALEPLTEGRLSTAQLALYIAWCVLNGYTEGHRGFEKRFVPRVLGRVAYLLRNKTPLRVILAPFFAMGYFAAKRRALLSAWGVSLAVVLAVVVVRAIPQPWRGIIDAGVVVGLGYGLGALLIFSVALWRGRFTPPDPEVPESTPPRSDAPESGDVRAEFTGSEPSIDLAKAR